MIQTSREDARLTANGLLRLGLESLTHGRPKQRTRLTIHCLQPSSSASSPVILMKTTNSHDFIKETPLRTRIFLEFEYLLQRIHPDTNRPKRVDEVFQSSPHDDGPLR